MSEDLSSELESRRLEQMIRQILDLEDENSKTGELPNDAMVERIRRIIIDSADRMY